MMLLREEVLMAADKQRRWLEDIIVHWSVLTSVLQWALQQSFESTALDDDGQTVEPVSQTASVWDDDKAN